MVKFMKRESKMTKRKEVYAAIDSERDYQDNLKKDRTSNPTDGTRSIDHTVGDFVTMMQQYQNNLVAAWTNNPGDQEAMEVMRKIGGIAVNCMEQHGAPHRVIPEKLPQAKLNVKRRYGSRR